MQIWLSAHHLSFLSLLSITIIHYNLKKFNTKFNYFEF
nr:MAG TPA: hypothetical protein [Caudoviricetes sp.]